jgi:hypothetical protein
MTLFIVVYPRMFTKREPNCALPSFIMPAGDVGGLLAGAKKLLFRTRPLSAHVTRLKQVCSDTNNPLQERKGKKS